MKRFFALLLAVMCLCPFAHAEELTSWLSAEVTEPITEFFANETLVTTVGTAEALAPIDIAVLSFSVEAVGETVAEANQQVTDRIHAITELMKAQGVEESQIWHKRYDVAPNVIYHNTKMTTDEVIEGYIVEIVLCVRLTDISLVGVVIDAAMQSGANTSHDLVYESSNAAEAYYAALAQATKLAMEKAGLLAESCGLKLQNLMSVVETSLPQDDFAAVEVTYLAK